MTTSTNIVPVEVKILRQVNGKDPLPFYATEGSAGIDFIAATPGTVVIDPGKTVFVPTGIAIWINDLTKALWIVPRSGLGCKHRVIPANSPGLVDSDFQNEIMICLTNYNEQDVFRFEPGDRIAQGVLMPVFRMQFNVVEEFSGTTKRGGGGFGHTGLKSS